MVSMPMIDLRKCPPNFVLFCFVVIIVVVIVFFYFLWMPRESFRAAFFVSNFLSPERQKPSSPYEERESSVIDSNGGRGASNGHNSD